MCEAAGFEGHFSNLSIRVRSLQSVRTTSVTAITEEMEGVLWQKGLLGDTDPTTLLHTMVYWCILHFGVRKNCKLYDIQHSQFALCTDGDGQRYVEFTQVVHLELHLVNVHWST
jgi:hypothetical protein